MSEDQDKALDLTGMKPIADAANEVTERSLDAAESFLKTICRPAAEEFGLLLRDRVRYWRTRNAANIAQKAAINLKEQADENKKYAHPRIVAQIIEQGSWIEQEDIQEMWGGLLTSSCTPDGEDDSNLTFVDLLARLTASQARILDYVCANAEKSLSRGGWLTGTQLQVDVEDLLRIARIIDIHRLDRELDHLAALGLFAFGSGFDLDSRVAHLMPSALALQMYARCHGHSEDPISFYGLPPQSTDQQDE